MKTSLECTGIINFFNELYIVNFPPFISGVFQRKVPGDDFLVQCRFRFK